MSTATDNWFVSRGGQRFGPVSFAQLIEAAQQGRLEPCTDLLFGGGLGEWTPAGQVDGVFERNRADAKKEEKASRSKGGDSMADAGEHEDVEKPSKLDMPGAPRLGYILGVTVLPTILAVGLAKLLPNAVDLAGEQYGQYAPLLMVLVPILALVITVKRFQNLSMSGWWILGLMVPLLNLWLNYRLLACPPGYAFTKKLDVWGWILASLYWLSVIGSIVAFFLFGMIALQQFREGLEGGQFQHWVNWYEETFPSLQQ